LPPRSKILPIRRSASDQPAADDPGRDGRQQLEAEFGALRSEEVQMTSWVFMAVLKVRVRVRATVQRPGRLRRGHPVPVRNAFTPPWRRQASS
jgi:hypothetical protein